MTFGKMQQALRWSEDNRMLGHSSDEAEEDDW